MPGFGYGAPPRARRRRVLDGTPPRTLPALSLSPASVAENSAPGVVIGAVQGRTTGSTLALANDAGGRFALSGGNIVAGLVATDFETASSHNITVRETLAGYANSPRDTVLAIAVTNVFEAPNLSALSLSSTAFTLGTATSGTIAGATSGSTIAATGLPAGLTINGPARSFAYDGTGTAGSATITLTETLADSANSPRGSTVAVSIASATVAGAGATDFSGTGVVPALHYHIPAGSAVTTTTIVTSPANVLAAISVADIRGLANATNAAGSGPIVMTDARGRRFLRFDSPVSADGPNGPNFLQVGTAFVASQRAISVFMIGRHHRGVTTSFFSLGLNGATPPNTSGAILNTSVSNTGQSPFLRGSSRAANAPVAGNAARILTGAQLHLMGVASRSTAVAGPNTGQLLFINNDYVQVDRAPTALSGSGAEIGRYAFAPGATDFFDLYEMAVFTGELTDAQAQAVAARLVANWQIPTIADQLVLEGDSITQGVFTGPAGSGVIAGENLAMQLTRPGAELIPASTRVINQGVSGNRVSNLVTRRDAGGVFSFPVAGRNIVAVQIGRNDLPSTTGAATYSQIVALINTATTGYLQRGWEVAQAVNIAVSSSLVTANTDLRTLLRAGTFLTDCNAGPAQSYAGRLRLVDLPLITVGNDTKFDTLADANDTAWFQGDATHPTRAATAALASGGDTPANGYGIIL